MNAHGGAVPAGTRRPDEALTRGGAQQSPATADPKTIRASIRHARAQHASSSVAARPAGGRAVH
jgi:hypothetical protein